MAKLPNKKNGTEYPNKAYKWGIYGIREFLPNDFARLKNIFKSLKHKNFSIFLIGQCITLVGAWIQQIALGWLTFEITNSLFLLSLTVFLTQIPTLFITPFAGFVSDKFDCKRILLITQSSFMMIAFALTVASFFGWINLYFILVISFIFGVTTSFDAPTRQSFYSQLVPKEDLSNAIALFSTIFNSSRFIGPALGGLMISRWDVSFCFLVNTLTFTASLFALTRIIPNRPPKRDSAPVLTEIKEGFVYMANSVPIRAIIILLMVVCFAGLPFTMLMPAFAKEVLRGDSTLLGNLMSCVGIGAFVAALFLAARSSVYGIGKVITFGTSTLGVSIALISWVRNPLLACFICLFIGFGIIATAASCNTILQTLVENSKRGRVMSIYTMCLFGIPPIGSIFQGYISRFLDAHYITFICGLVCVLSAIIFEYFRPTIRKHARKIIADKDIIPEIARGLNPEQNR